MKYKIGQKVWWNGRINCFKNSWINQMEEPKEVEIIDIIDDHMPYLIQANCVWYVEEKELSI